MRAHCKGFELLHLSLLMILLAGLSGCLSTKAYVDPKYRNATYASIIKRGNVKPVMLEASFQVNGTDRPAVDMKVGGAARKDADKIGHSGSRRAPPSASNRGGSSSL